MTYTNMTLDDLKTGMIVTRRDGVELIVFRGCTTTNRNEHDFIISVDGEQWDPLKYYRNDFTNNHDFSNYDIVKVEQPSSPRGIMIKDCCTKDRVLLWEERPAVKLTVAEIEERLGYKIEIVSDEEED